MPPFTLTAPSRLHFGLWSLGSAVHAAAERQFGGVGVMIENPALQLVVRDAAEFAVVGPTADRASVFAGRWAQFHHLELPRCHIEIVQAIPSHAGLGSGTQLALGIAAALNARCDITDSLPQDLARSVGRGLRSAVGTYGFVFGGLIVEQGKLPEEAVSPLEYRLDLPPQWRFVLIRPTDATGLAGDDEVLAFDRLSPVASTISDELCLLARKRMVPAVCRGDFEAFAACLYQYGRLSGECFAERQGGPYNGPVITQLVERIRSLEYVGVGQSSWGPTVFVATPSQGAAEQLERMLVAESPLPLEIVVARPASQGATLCIQ